MLSKEEVVQLHTNGTIFREGKIVGKIPFVVKTFSMEDNLKFAAAMDKLEITDSDLHINNVVAQNTLKGCLVSINGRKVLPNEFGNMTVEKCNYIIEFWRTLCADLTKYLEGFSEQPLDVTELEEFILTDAVERVETLEYEEGVPPIEIKYKILPVGEITKVTESLRETLKQKISKLHATVITDRAFAAKTITSIAGVEINQKTINEFNVELINFIMGRAASVEQQLGDYLRNPNKMGEALKN